MRRSTLVALLVGVTLLAPAVVHAAACPNPKTCPDYSIWNTWRGWRASTDGLIRIPYYVNPSGQTPPVGAPLSDAKVAGAAKAAFATWQAWNPRLRPVYKGLTDVQPDGGDGVELVVPRDGKTVIGFRDDHASMAHVERRTDSSSYIVEADIWLDPQMAWAWRPCAQRNNTCTDGRHYRNVSTLRVPGTSLALESNYSELDLQAVLTHEIGHLLGLQHPEGTKSYELTMRFGSGHPEPAPDIDFRRFSTLGLGDVLGMKKLYPWKCPRLKKGQRYRSAYRYLCPSIQIFAP